MNLVMRARNAIDDAAGTRQQSLLRGAAQCWLSDRPDLLQTVLRVLRGMQGMNPYMRKTGDHVVGRCRSKSMYAGTREGVLRLGSLTQCPCVISVISPRATLLKVPGYSI